MAMMTGVTLVPMVGTGIGVTGRRSEGAYDERGLIALARRAVSAEVRGEPAPSSLSGRTPARPVFVTVEIDGLVRGCRGDLRTRARSLEEEVVLAARGAAAHDPKFRPLAPGD
ncbi:AMMECR1 domain-containing protein, partial [bacterium]